MGTFELFEFSHQRDEFLMLLWRVNRDGSYEVLLVGQRVMKDEIGLGCAHGLIS